MAFARNNAVRRTSYYYPAVFQSGLIGQNRLIRRNMAAIASRRQIEFVPEGSGQPAGALDKHHM
jgi:hypothetical protein